MANITISGNNFYGKSSAIRNLNEADVDFARIIRELEAIRSHLEDGSEESHVVETLEKQSRAGNWQRLCTTVRDFSLQFSNAALASLAGGYLSQLTGLCP